MLRLADEALFARGAARALDTRAELARRKFARLTETRALGETAAIGGGALLLLGRGARRAEDAAREPDEKREPRDHFGEIHRKTRRREDRNP